MGYRWKPSKGRAREFAKTMDEIGEFCRENGIDQSTGGDSYYFELNGQKYRVSNHTVAQSNRGAYDEIVGQKRGLYHPDGEREDTIYITAGKTRIRQIYNDLKAGRELDRRGNRK